MHWNETVTVLLFHPAAFGEGDTEAVTTSGGKVCSVKLAVAVFELPALSVAVPLMVCRPFVLTTTGAGQVNMPDKASKQVNVTVALAALTIPPGSGAGVIVAVMVGGVLSMLMLMLVGVLFPATSVAVPLTL